MSELNWAKLQEAIKKGDNLPELILDTQGVSMFITPETKPSISFIFSYILDTSPCNELYVTTDIPDELLQFSFMRNHLSIHEVTIFEKNQTIESPPIIDTAELLSLQYIV